MTLSLAQFGVPGLVEILVVTLIMLVFLAVPVLLILVLFSFLRRSPKDERIQQLEREVAELRGRLDERDRREGDE